MYAFSSPWPTLEVACRQFLYIPVASSLSEGIHWPQASLRQFEHGQKVVSAARAAINQGGMGNDG